MSSKTAESLPPITAKAYAVVPNSDDDLADDHQELQTMPTATTIRAAQIDLDRPAGHVVSPDFGHIPEARGLVWKDDFFDDDDDNVVAVFDFDYAAMESHYGCLSWSMLGVSAMCVPSIIPFLLLGLVPCHVNKNVRWNVRAQHLAVTRDGIVFVHDHRPTCWGSCSVSKRTKTIPFDQITDIELTATGVSSSTCVIGNPLSKVTIDTASARSKPAHELVIDGLEDPEAFKKLVLAMKRIYHPTVASIPTAMTMASERSHVVVADEGTNNRVSASAATGDSASPSNQDLAVLLREIRDELRQQNASQALQQQAAGPASQIPPVPSAPLAPQAKQLG